MKISDIQSKQVAIHKADEGITGEIVGWSTSDYGATVKITIRRCIAESFFEQTFDADELGIEADISKARAIMNEGKWITVFYAFNYEKDELPEHACSHCMLIHINKKDVVEDMIREILNSPMFPLLTTHPAVIKLWAEDKKVIGVYSIDYSIKMRKEEKK
jgi:hypothetical protein